MKNTRQFIEQTIRASLEGYIKNWRDSPPAIGEDAIKAILKVHFGVNWDTKTGILTDGEKQVVGELLNWRVVQDDIQINVRAFQSLNYIIADIHI